ncbi:MAG: aminopeptidase [Eubacteriales bacterium]|nr:aminopeptidase [Eubacteriales bacterium]
MKSEKEKTSQASSEEVKTRDVVKKLKKTLENEHPNLWDTATAEEISEINAFADQYKSFLDRGKTERDFVTVTVETLESLGYEPLRGKTSLKAGDKVYQTIRGKAVNAAIIGQRPLADGCNLVGAHVDAPRLDLKPHPVYEDSDLVLLKTHYYGGIKKYQWAAIPLAIHGIVYRMDGSPVTISIGESADDPVMTITDLLPHLGKEQMSRKAPDLIKGEELNILIGGLPYPDTDTSGRFKLAILKLLHDRYQITERDLISAELEIVPAGQARDVGLDRSFIGAYGQDDRVCAYTALAALTSLNTTDKTVVCMLFDKEEVGSDGNTGAQSRAYENFLYELLARSEQQADRLSFQMMIENSKMLSADVTNAYDPTFSSVSDSRNNNYLNRGISLVKYTGSRGKSGTSDANVEFLNEVIRTFEANDIPWQTGEMGKVDEGGGGTIAKFLANLGMEVLDCGVPVLSMHSPFEITSKMDVYMTFQAYRVFFEHI